MNVVCSRDSCSLRDTVSVYIKPSSREREQEKAKIDETNKYLNKLLLTFAASLAGPCPTIIQITRKPQHQLLNRTIAELNTLLTHFVLETPTGVLAKSADPDQMPHNVASELGLHYFASCSAIFQQKFSINIT